MINIIADIIGVGIVWFFDKGIANIVSQFWLAAYSKWHMSYNTNKFHHTRNGCNLYYEVTTQERVKCQFILTLKGLHAFTTDKKNSKTDFGIKMISNSVICRSRSYHITITNRDNIEVTWVLDNQENTKNLGITGVVEYNSGVSSNYNNSLIIR